MDAACDLLGDLDLEWAEEQREEFDDYSLRRITVTAFVPVAFRKAAARAVEKPLVSRKKAVLQPNFEVLLPPDLDAKPLYELARRLEICGPHALKLSTQALAEAGKEFASAAEFWKELRKYLEGEIPPNVEAFVAERFSPAQRVLLGREFIYVRDAETCAKVKALAGKYVYKELDGRLLLLNPFTSLRVIRDRLLKAKYIVEDPTQAEDLDEVIGF